MNERPEFSYIGQCPHCKAYCSSVVDDPDYPRFTSESVAKMIKAGLTVTRVPDEFVREHFGRCDCKSKPKNNPQQLRMF